MNSRPFLVAHPQQLRSLSTIWPHLPHFCGNIINWILNNALKSSLGLFSPLLFVQSLWSAIIYSNWMQNNSQPKSSFKCPAHLYTHVDARHTACCCSDLCLRKDLINCFSPCVLHQCCVSGESSLAWLFLMGLGMKAQACVSVKCSWGSQKAQLCT